MRYLLDTCVISDFIKGETGTLSRLKQTPPEDIAVSAITAMELHYGLVLNPRRAPQIQPAITSLLSAITVIPFSAAEAEQATQIRADLKVQGQPIGAYDVLIAATALHHGCTMVTANQREFNRIAGLCTENWRHS